MRVQAENRFRHFTPEELVAYAYPTPGNRLPTSTGYFYSNTNYVLAGMIIAQGRQRDLRPSTPAADLQAARYARHLLRQLEATGYRHHAHGARLLKSTCSEYRPTSPSGRWRLWPARTCATPISLDRRSGRHRVDATRSRPLDPRYLRRAGGAAGTARTDEAAGVRPRLASPSRAPRRAGPRAAEGSAWPSPGIRGWAASGSTRASPWGTAASIHLVSGDDLVLAATLNSQPLQGTDQVGALVESMYNIVMR